MAAQFAAEATLRRVHAAQKDDDMPPIEAILAPLEAELKLSRQEVIPSLVYPLVLLFVLCRCLSRFPLYLITISPLRSSHHRITRQFFMYLMRAKYMTSYLVFRFQSSRMTTEHWIV